MMRVIMVSLIVLAPYHGFCQPATSPPAFEVASVKPNKAGDSTPWRFATSRGDITATNVTLKFVIMNAYSVRDDQVSGGPNWLNSKDTILSPSNLVASALSSAEPR